MFRHMQPHSKYRPEFCPHSSLCHTTNQPSKAHLRTSAANAKFILTNELRDVHLCLFCQSAVQCGIHEIFRIGVKLLIWRKQTETKRYAVCT